MSASDFWPFFPQRQFTEMLEWKSEILQARGSAQRIAWRGAPRAGAQVSFLLDARETSRALAFCHKASHQEFKVPAWGDLMAPGALASGAASIAMDTTAIDLRDGDELVVWDDSNTWELATAATVGGASVALAAPLGRAYARPRVAPVRRARFEHVPEWTRKGRGLAAGRAEFVSTDTRDLAQTGIFPIYRGFEVMTDRAAEVDTYKDGASRAARVVDNGVGPIFADAALNYAQHEGTLAWSALKRPALWAVRGWLHARRGRQRGFWWPSWRADLSLAANISAGATTLHVQAIGWPDLYGVRDILILTTSGTMYFRRVLAAASGAPGQEDLSLDSAIGVALTMAQVRLICLLTFMRLDSDKVEIRRGGGLRADISLPVVEEPAP